MTSTPSVLIIGLGSIGQRHLRNLVTLGVEDITLFSTGYRGVSDSLRKRHRVAPDLDSALSRRPDAVIVATPTAHHLTTAIRVAEAGCHLFIEKPISHSAEGIESLLDLVGRQSLIVQTGFQFRFHPSLRSIRDWIHSGAIGEVASVRAVWGEYLPSWHPWEDYRYGYSARADLGGGVILTLCHPFDYLRWLLGDVDSLMAMCDSRSGLALDVEDVAAILMRFRNGAIGTLHLDYLEYPQHHAFTILGQRGRITWDNSDGAARLYDLDGREAEHYQPHTDFERNALFLDEMAHFLDCIATGRQPDCSLSDGIRALDLCLTVKDATTRHERITVRSSLPSDTEKVPQ